MFILFFSGRSSKSPKEKHDRVSTTMSPFRFTVRLQVEKIHSTSSMINRGVSYRTIIKPITKDNYDPKKKHTKYQKTL